MGPKGVETKDLTAVQVAPLTIYDMCKADELGDGTLGREILTTKILVFDEWSLATLTLRCGPVCWYRFRRHPYKNWAGISRPVGWLLLGRTAKR